MSVIWKFGKSYRQFSNVAKASFFFFTCVKKVYSDRNSPPKTNWLLIKRWQWVEKRLYNSKYFIYNYCRSSIFFLFRVFFNAKYRIVWRRHIGGRVNKSLNTINILHSSGQLTLQFIWIIRRKWNNIGGKISKQS